MLGTAGTAQGGPALDFLQVSKGKKNTKTCKPGGWCWDPGLPVGFAGVPWIAASLCCWSGHCREAADGKRARQRGKKLPTEDAPSLPPVGAGSARGGAATPHTAPAPVPAAPGSIPGNGR